MPPAFTRGVVPVRTLVPGGVRHPHPFHKKCEEWNCKHRKINYLTLSEIRTPPVPALAQGHPPHKCGGQGRVPHPPAHHSTNSSTNSNLPQCRFTSKIFLYGNYITTFSKLQCLSGHIWGGRELSGKRYPFRRNKYLLSGALVVRCMWWRLGFCQRTTALFCRTRRIYRIS